MRAEPDSLVPGSSAPGLEVLDPGALATVQDRGRAVYAHLGVPRSGALDRSAYDQANRLLGNDAGAAVIETTVTGAEFRARRDLVVAVTGAICEVRVAGRAASWGRAVWVPAGARLTLGRALDGVRSYLAVAGGVAATPVLGSCSTDLLSGLGPAPLAAGDLVRIGARSRVPTQGQAVPPRRGGEVRVIPGPHEEWFTDPAALGGARFEVQATSNRIGVRLQGPRLAWATDAELPSAGMVLGSIQVPPSGDPIILLADHATTGGYPVIGVVARHDLDVVAQARPGDQLALRWAARR